MPLAYQGVQAGHAVAQWMLDNPGHHWNNSTLVYLNVKDETDLKIWMRKLSIKGIDYSEFIEPDIGDEFTAIAAYNDNEKPFSKLKLMGSQ